jgi:hypothetical protein
MVREVSRALSARHYIAIRRVTNPPHALITQRLLLLAVKVGALSEDGRAG